MSSDTVGLAEAAELLRLSEDALMRKTRAGAVPGAKIGPHKPSAGHRTGTAPQLTRTARPFSTDQPTRRPTITVLGVPNHVTANVYLSASQELRHADHV